MTLLRPAIRDWLVRWGESLALAVMVAIGGWLFLHGHARFNWMLETLGIFLTLAAAVACWAALQRARFKVQAEGPGLVEVTERRVSYLTSFGGDSIDLTAITRLEVRSLQGSGRVWVVKQDGGPTLFIPLGAAGADGLFDVFSALPGLDGEALISAVHGGGNRRHVIWRRGGGDAFLT